MISIIIPLYNKGKYIKNTIDSILSQNFDDFEIVVVNDGSTDNSFEIVKGIQSDKIKLYTKENGGPASARNMGIQKAVGEWIIILDADDTLESDALEHFQHLTIKHPKCNFFCCNHYIQYNGNKQLYSDKYTEGFIRNNFFSWCIGEFMPVAGACMIKKDLLLKYPFKEKLRRYEDAESLFNIMRDERIYRSPIPTMTYNRDHSSASHARKNIEEDFIGHLSLKGKGLWERYAIWQLYQQGRCLYPNTIDQLYNKKDFEGIGFRLCYYIEDRLTKHDIALRTIVKKEMRILYKIIKNKLGL